MKKRPFVNHNSNLLFLFVFGSFLFIEFNFRYWYSFLEQFMMFQTTVGYWRTQLAAPGGINECFTEFLSLAFYYPLGAATVIAFLLCLLSLGFYEYLKAFRKNVPVLLVIVPAFLFWLNPQESIAMLVMVIWALSSASLYVRIEPAELRFFIGGGLTTISYFIATPAHILLAVLILLYEFFGVNPKKGRGFALVNLLWAVILPLVAMRTLYVLPMREAFLSKHLSHPEYPIPTFLGIITASFPVLTCLFVALKDKTFIRKESWKWVLSYSVLLIGMAWAIIAIKNPMEQAYCYDYYARQGEWQKILHHAHTHGVKDKDALVYVNLALSKQGRFTEDFLRFPQIGEEGFIPHDPKSRLGLIEASEVAWQVGQVNAAQRFAFVGVLSSQRCVQPRLMKRLVETYLVTGEYGAAAKYIKILESYPHYRDWATAQRPLLDPKVCSATDWVVAKRKVLPLTDNPFDLTKAFPSAIAYLIDDHAENQQAFEYGMAYLLAYKDLEAFMHYMELKKKRGESFPEAYQEAICLYYAAVKRDPETFKSYSISPEVHTRFMQFLQVARTTPPEVLKKQFGDTYYYYAQFVPTPKR